MIKDYSKLPCNITITNNSDKDITINESYIPFEIPANGSIIVSIRTSERLAQITKSVNDICELSLEVGESKEEPEVPPTPVEPPVDPEPPAQEVTSDTDVKNAFSDPEVTDIKFSEDLTEIKSKLSAKGKSITVDGNGNTVKFSSKNSNFYAGKDGEITLKNMTIQMDGESNQGVTVAYGGKVTIGEDVVIETLVDNKYPIATMDEGSTLNVYGTIKGGNYGCISGNSAYGGTTTNIYKGAKLSSTGEISVYVPQDGEVNIYGGEITGPSAIMIKSGKLNILGGTLKGTGKNVEAPTPTSDGRGWGDAVCIEVNKSYPGGKTDNNIKVYVSEEAQLLSDNANAIKVLNAAGKSIEVTGAYTNATTTDNVTIYSK